MAGNSTFAIILVLFILLVIIGCGTTCASSCSSNW
ncbi:MAG: YjcZ family sporulation protein [Bacilli bacterium]|nr:YjcZ family sporulation protein [Bacillales bacterium]MDY2574557.1 YjcZ family sporulation protein [Bacilli bacterium]